ncbi:efflux transporter outer membrane subunit [Variovorax saccharolyticus]|uniref:efflux transporter outer membrane subunit n=1 Tax=Variovorax saccharolyticus TaxID=3053516 RepID=UPI00257523FB|nr:efflux transporter outer membrane subunit [Variovorax sp. J31P216]MDM0024441.1 efflux transporter outer membrane subunit [Variovorax sp. J31P216]
MRRVEAAGIRSAAAGGLALLLAGCMLGPDYKRPEMQIPAQFRGAAPPTAAELALPDTAWWRQFGDAELDALIVEGLRNNLDLVVAAARVEQFYGALGTTRAQLFPQIGAEAAGSRTRASEQTISPAPSINPYNAAQATLLASWEIDLFGRTRRLTEAATAELQASESFRRGIVLSVVAAVTTGYVRLRELDRELEVARSTLALRQDSLNLFERRFKGGVVSQVEVSQARSEYATALRAIPLLVQSIAQQENALSVLIGRDPGPIARGRSIDALAMPTVPAGLPSELLDRRPDILQAEQTLVAANARIGAAKAAYFPTISLTGAFGQASRSLSDLWSGPARIWSYGADVSLPIFTAGAIAGQVERAEAEQRAAVAQYRKTVQAAFGETADALAGIVNSREGLDAQQMQVGALVNYARLSRKRFEGGYTSYLEVMDADRSLFNAQVQLARSQGDVLLQAAALYKSLGGGWVELANQDAPQPAVRLGQRPPLWP